MDRRKHEDESSEAHKSRLQNLNTEIRRRDDDPLADAVAAKKILKADREKVRRDRINEHFQELGSILDPDRHKNDKSTIISDTIQALKELTSEVEQLKTDHAALFAESRQLIQEKSDLREEKASLKLDIESLKARNQQSYCITLPWASYDHSLVKMPPYTLPVPLPVPSGPMPFHPTMQHFPFFGSQPYPRLIPYRAPASPHIEQPSSACSLPSHTSVKQDPKVRSSTQDKIGSVEKPAGPVDVRTDLELKIPGSNVQKVGNNWSQDNAIELSGSKGKQILKDVKNAQDTCGASRHSSSHSFQDSMSDM